MMSYHLRRNRVDHLCVLTYRKFTTLWGRLALKDPDQGLLVSSGRAGSCMWEKYSGLEQGLLTGRAPFGLIVRDSTHRDVDSRLLRVFQRRRML